MEFPKNIYKVNHDEVEEILNEVAAQIKDENSNKTRGKDVVARIGSYRNYESAPSQPHWGIKCHHKDAILEAVKEIKKNGWHCWYHFDYEQVLSVWVTKSDVRPHPWYSKM